MLFCASIPQRVREMASRIDPDKRRDGDRIATTSIEALLVDGRDDDFRELIALLYATSGRLQSMRRELATALSLSIAEFAVLSALMYLAPKGNTRIGTIAEHSYRGRAGHRHREPSGARRLGGKIRRSLGQACSPASIDADGE